jgi:hypothetical protein
VREKVVKGEERKERWGVKWRASVKKRGDESRGVGRKEETREEVWEERRRGVQRGEKRVRSEEEGSKERSEEVGGE